jgi:hypothetical protein
VLSAGPCQKLSMYLLGLARIQTSGGTFICHHVLVIQFPAKNRLS